MGRSNFTALEEQIVTTAIAVDKDKSSQHAVKWAVDNLLNKTQHFVLLHVRNPNSDYNLDYKSVPRGDQTPNEDELHQLFLPFRAFCARKGVEAKEVVLQDVEVQSALLAFINKNSISTIVVGASGRNAFTRNFKKADVPTTLTKQAPDYCTVYVIEKGRVHSCRSSSQPSTPNYSRTRFSPNYPPEGSVSEYTVSTYGNSSTESWKSGSSDMRSGSSDRSSDLGKNSWATYPGSKIPSPQRSTDITDFSTRRPVSMIHANSSTLDFDAEMVKLKLELKQNMEIYNAVCSEDLTAKHRAPSRQLKGSYLWKSDEFQKLEKANHDEEDALAIAVMRKERSKSSVEALLSASQTKAKHGGEDEKRVVMPLAHTHDLPYRRYTLREIEIATDYFSDSLKVGEGGYGPVFRATLDEIDVAVKVLRPDISQGQMQFQKEVDVLGGMRHPNLVLLLGACPEYGCLVYEYMANGSLEDRLFQKDNSPPIPWKTRFKIAAEISNGLLFLHQRKPEPVVHRDLKPANILINSNYVSKISDVGLARLIPASMADNVTQYHMTAAAGTFCYIDPEYQQTGMLGVKSDVYSLGVMLLQIITAKPPMGLTLQVERAIDSGKFAEILDRALTDWPVQEALSYARLALQCCELRKKDRPDLGSVVVPEMNRLRDLGSDSGNIPICISNCVPNPSSSPNTNQIKARRRWQQQFKLFRGRWTMKIELEKNGILPRQQDKDNGNAADKKHFKDFWSCSFVNCSIPKHQMKRMMSM